jgi:hypothetical protein
LATFKGKNIHRLSPLHWDFNIMLKHVVLSAALAALLTGCDAYQASRADQLPLSEVKLDGREPIGKSVAAEARFTVTSVELSVPPTLRVSEANLFFPDADVVWRGEPAGNRLAQVAAILNEGVAKGVAAIKSGPNVILSLRLERFHALTEKARYAVGGVHDVVLVLTVLDAQTRTLVEGPRRVEIAIRAAGGNLAIAEDAAGRTQRVVIVEGVSEAIRRELTGAAPSSVPQRPKLFGGFY